MSLLLGALYQNRDLDEVRHAWRSRMSRMGDARLQLEVHRVKAASEGLGLERTGGPTRFGFGSKTRLGGAGARHDLVQVEVSTRKGRRVPHRRLGGLVRMALGPEREERAEFWLLEPAEVDPGALRLAGADWGSCLQSIGLREHRQVRLWSPMICPGGLRDELEEQGWELGLEMRVAECWAVMAIPRPATNQSFPPPWKGNYGW